MSMYPKKPNATPEQVEEAIKQEPILVYGTLTVKEAKPITTKNGPSQIREISLKVEVWPEGYQESLSGYITWKLWGGQCDTAGEEIKALYEDQGLWVKVHGLHQEGYNKQSGERVTYLAARAFSFEESSLLPGGELQQRVFELELRLGKLQEQLDSLSAKENEFAGF